MASSQTVTPRQLALARAALWHQDGSALRTLDDARQWLDSAGLVPFYPHAQFATPAPSFAEAILGRPENGWIPKPARRTAAAPDGSDEETFTGEVEDEEPEDEESFTAEDADDDLNDDDEPGEGLDIPEQIRADADPSAGDDEIMLSDDDEFEEDEGDEIAEEDRIRAGGDPLPHDLSAPGSAIALEPAVPAEAVAEPAPAPINGFSPEEREIVSRTLARLVADGSAVPLNLLGSTTGEPDYVCSAQAFSFVYTLRGDKTWKQEPAQTGSMRVSPLAVKVYEILKDKGATAPHDLAQELGQGIVDSAVLRALSELWAIQRVLPIPDADGKPTKWEVMTGRFMRHLKAGANAGQPTALSALLSLYLAQVAAATAEEMEIFLSPLVARSRVREVVNGLSATQQLDTLVIEGKTLLHIAGDLPDFAADDTPAAVASPQRSRYERDDRMAAGAERAARGPASRPSSRDARPERKGNYPVRKPAGARSPGDRFGGARADRGGPPRTGGPRFSGGASRPGFSRPDSAGGPPDRERRPFQRSAAPSERNEFARPWDEDRKASPDADRPTRDDAETRPARDSGGSRPVYGRRESAAPGGRPSFGDRKPYAPREGGGERRPYAAGSGSGGGARTGAGGERRSFGDRKPYAPRDGAASGDRKPYAPREGGERRPFTPRGDGERRPFTPRDSAASGERGPYPRREGTDARGDRKPFGDRKPYAPRDSSSSGERRPFTPRDGGERRPFAPRGDGERRSYAPREGGERRPFPPREGGERRPFPPRDGAGGDRPAFSGSRKPFSGGENRGRTGFGGPRSASGTDGARGERPSRERFSGEPGEGRPSFQSGAHSAGPGGAKFGASTFGKGRPGKFGKPGFSPSRKGPGAGPGRGGAPKRRAD